MVFELVCDPAGEATIGGEKATINEQVGDTQQQKLLAGRLCRVDELREQRCKEYDRLGVGRGLAGPRR